MYPENEKIAWKCNEAWRKSNTYIRDRDVMYYRNGSSRTQLQFHILTFSYTLRYQTVIA